MGIFDNTYGSGGFGQGSPWMPNQPMQGGGGILGGAPQPQGGGWGSTLGILGAGLADAGAQFAGHPADAVNLQNQILMQRQMGAQRALQSTPFSGDAQAYMQQLLQSGVPVETAIQAASGMRGLQGVKTLSADEKKAAGFNPDAVIQQEPGGKYDTAQQSDVPTSAAQAYQSKLHTITPITDPNDPRLPPKNTRPPGTTYGTDAYGNVVETNKGDAKSPIAQQQAVQDRTAAMAEQMRMYGIGLPTNGGASGAAPLTGDTYLKSLPPAMAGTVKSIADYRVQAPSASSRSPGAIALLNAVNQYAPGFDATQFNAKNKARGDYINGPDGKSTTAINTAVDHLGTLGQLAGALGNGNIQAFNSLGQSFAQQTGSPAPTNFDSMKQIVGDEIVKALVGTGGSSGDREKASDTISRANSPAQLAGAIQTYQQALAGKLGPLRQKYQFNTKLQDFNDMLTPQTQQVLGALPQGGAGGKPPPAPGAVLPKLQSKSRFKIEQVDH